MNLMMIGKYPPIQGGESSKIYWLMRGLANRGNKISVISNCMEVETPYRCQLDEEDIERLQPEGVSLRSTLPIDNPNFIPQTNPYAEKIISLALDEGESNPPDFILSWYLLPYGVSAHYVSLALGKKFGVGHAGSDLTRLLESRQLEPILKRVITSADAIFTYPGMEDFFGSLGCSKILTHVPTLPEEFNPDSGDFNLEHMYGLRIDPERTLTYFGKMSEQKGVGLLLDAFSDMDCEKELIIVGGGNTEHYKRKSRSLGIEENVHFLGNLAPWRIPDIIRSSKAIVVPEWNFGVSLHKSRIPIESILCGRTPLVSSQVIGNYGSLSNYFIEINPKDRSSFSETLTQALDNGKLNSRVISNHEPIRNSVGDFDDYVERFETLLHEAKR